ARGNLAAPAVVRLQPLRRIVLVAARDRSPARHHGPQAREVAARAPVARRAVAGAPRAREPAVSPRARAAGMALAVLEELLHRRGRRPQDLGTLLAPTAPQSRPGDGALVARRAT